MGPGSTPPTTLPEAPPPPAPDAPQKSASLSKEELTEATANGLRWISMSRVGTECLLVVGMVVLARLIPPAQFGAFAVALIVGQLAVGIPTEGIGSALVQRDAVTREHLQSGAALSLIAALGMGGVTWLLSYVAIAPLCGAEAAALVRLSCPLFLLASLGTIPTALLRRRLDFRHLAIMEISGSAARSSVAVALAVLAGLGGSALVLGTIAGAAVSTAIAMAAAPMPWPRLRRAPARDIAGYGVPASLAAVAWSGFANGDYVVIAARLGTVAAGLYWRAYTLAVDYQGKASVVMYTMAFPVLSRSTNDDDLLALRSRMVRLLTVVLFPLLTGLAITAPVVIPLVFGPNWQQAILPTQLLCIGGASSLVIDAVGAGLMAAGRPRALLAYGVTHFMVYVGSVVIVAPLGIVAVAADAAAVHALFLVIAYVVLLEGKAENPLRALWRDLAPAIIACLSMAAAAVPVSWLASALHLDRPLHFIAVATVGGIAYLLALRMGFSQSWADLGALTRRLLPADGLQRRVRALRFAGAR
jgi:O-antigen/teichoic acid export membrane protein